MRKIALFLFVLFAIPSFPLPSQAQAAQAGAQQVHYYHLEFVVKQLGDDGKVVNSRTYDTTISTETVSSVRAGTRIPVRMNDEKGDIQYLDVGINIDCNQAHETPDGLALRITAEISSLANPIASGDIPDPIIRANKWQAIALLPLGKPTLVFSSDNLDNKGKMQVEVTARPM